MDFDPKYIDMEDLQIKSGVNDGDDFAWYKIKVDESFQRVLDVLGAGGTITLTYPDGKKKSLVLEDIK